MNRNLIALVIVAALAGGIYWFGFRDDPQSTPASSERKVLHYRDPMGGPDRSPVPKKDSMGMDYLPVYADEKPEPKQDASDRGRLLYYRNPMGLADTSPVPKKDSMGMDYIPVYEKEVSSPGTVQVDTARLQRAGVRTEAATLRPVTSEIQAAGVVAIDQTRLAVVAPRVEGWIARVYVGAPGLDVKAAQPLVENYSPELVQLQDEYRLAREAGDVSTAATLADSALKRLQNLG
ncbi:MAG: efflux RND transporter periplasmic adaptor subunit, partial [Pirellulales bacterium]